MTVCPIAIAVGCKKCPMFSICPAKSIIGDQAPSSAKPDEKPADQSANKSH
ncbi:MAG: hypothetical protein KA388_10295 [Rhodocyclaceae bacterium]|nr:hypothetical protein [Rhodocyclaceae bacterium]